MKLISQISLVASLDTSQKNDKGSDQTKMMLSMVCTFVVCMRQSQGFLQWGTFNQIWFLFFDLNTNLLSFFLSVSSKGSGENVHGTRREKTGLLGFANNKGAGQPAQTDQRLCYSLFVEYHI